MSPQVKEIAMKPNDDLGLILGTHMIAETVSGKLSSDLHTENNWISK